MMQSERSLQAITNSQNLQIAFQQKKIQNQLRSTPTFQSEVHLTSDVICLSRKSEKLFRSRLDARVQ